MAEGVTHISLPTQEYDRGRQEKTNRRTNTNNKLGVNQEQRKVCNTTCMCILDSRYGLTLAWVTSENSTMLLESDILRLFFTGPYLVSSPLCSVSLVLTAPPWIHANFSVRLSLVQPQLFSLLSSHQLSSLLSNYQLSRVQPPTLLSCHQLLRGLQPQTAFCCLPLCSPATNSLCSCPTTNCLSLGRVVNSRSRPLTTSGYGEISGPRILCLVSRQNRLVCFGGLPP